MTNTERKILVVSSNDDFKHEITTALVKKGFKAQNINWRYSLKNAKLDSYDAFLLSGLGRCISDAAMSLISYAEANEKPCYYFAKFDGNIGMDDAKYVLSHSQNPQLGVPALTRVSSADLFGRAKILPSAVHYMF